MEKNLQDNLFKKYPDLFQEKNLDMTKTCMCWGIDTPDHWYDTIDTLCEKIVSYNKHVKALQVKEKYGELCFYLDWYDGYLDKFIEEANEEIRKICAVCGSRENVKYSNVGWFLYKCEKCI